MTTVLPQLMTADEFWQLPDHGGSRELVRGEVRELMPPGGLHGIVAGKVMLRLGLWAEQSGAGTVGVEAGYRLSTNPDTLRAPDVAFVSKQHIPAEGVPDGYWQRAPDLAVEIISPHDTAVDVREKVQDYLSAGTAMVWQVFPLRREVIVHTPDGLARTFTAEGTLEFPDLLPGFSCRVAELFE